MSYITRFFILGLTFVFGPALKNMLLLGVNHLLQEQYEDLAVIHYSILESANSVIKSVNVTTSFMIWSYSRVSNLEFMQQYMQ